MPGSMGHIQYSHMQLIYGNFEETCSAIKKHGTWPWHIKFIFYNIMNISKILQKSKDFYIHLNNYIFILFNNNSNNMDLWYTTRVSIYYSSTSFLKKVRCNCHDGGVKHDYYPPFPTPKQWKCKKKQMVLCKRCFPITKIHNTYYARGVK